MIAETLTIAEPLTKTLAWTETTLTDDTTPVETTEQTLEHVWTHYERPSCSTANGLVEPCISCLEMPRCRWCPSKMTCVDMADNRECTNSQQIESVYACPSSVYHSWRLWRWALFCFGTAIICAIGVYCVCRYLCFPARRRSNKGCGKAPPSPRESRVLRRPPQALKGTMAIPVYVYHARPQQQTQYGFAHPPFVMPPPYMPLGPGGGYQQHPPLEGYPPPTMIPQGCGYQACAMRPDEDNNVLTAVTITTQTETPSPPSTPRRAASPRPPSPVTIPTTPASPTLSPRGMPYAVTDQTVHQLREDLEQERQQNKGLRDKVSWLNQVVRMREDEAALSPTDLPPEATKRSPLP